jgi:hypothetical protein
MPGYLIIGHDDGTIWTLTSAEGDIIDQYAERLCGGSPTRYRYKGRCRRMQVFDAGTITKGGDSIDVTIRRTAHGTVAGYARVAGGKRTVALARRRSSYGRESVDSIFFRRLTFGQVEDARDFAAAAATTPETFNAFWANARDISFYATGRLPLRPRGVNPDLPVDGRGRFEWRGFLSKRRHAQAVNPPSGMLVNWNNKPAPGYPASDSRFGTEGPVPRDKLLLRELARTRKHTLATVLGAENGAATGDPRTFVWPVIAKVLAKAPAPSPLASAMAATLDRWAANDGGWIDSDLDGFVDDPGQAVMVASWDRLAGAALCGRLGGRLCLLLERLNVRFGDPPGSNQYAGWHQYLYNDLRAVLGRRFAGRYHVGYCGKGKARACARSLWAALDEAGREEAQIQVSEDPSAWKLATRKLQFSPLPLAEMQYTNRPTGLHQVFQFAP